ncbi:TonB-dependent receptor plug domain-containing protein [candidate division KSB1 bacterium]
MNELRNSKDLSMVTKRLVFMLLHVVVLLISAYAVPAAQQNITASARDTTGRIFRFTSDSLFSDGLDQYHFIFSNTEETVDGLINIPGFTNLDLGVYGQFSSVSFRGTGHSNVIPVLNGIPLESESFGSWNWLDIPFYIIKRAETGRQAAALYPGVLKPVALSTFDQVETIPFSRINYRIGRYEYSHTDVSIARKLSQNLDLYAAGSTDHYTGAYIDRYNKRFRGSNVWLDLNYTRNDWKFRTEVFLSDKNNPELDYIPEQNEIVLKTKSHSRNIKLGAFSINNSRYDNLEVKLYAWKMNDLAFAQSNYLTEFRNSEKTIGAVFHGTLSEDDYHQVQFNYHGRFVDINGTYYDRIAWDNIHKISLNISRRLSDGFSINMSPQMDVCVGENLRLSNNVLVPLGIVRGEYTGMDHNIKCALSLSRSKRQPSMGKALAWDTESLSTLGEIGLYSEQPNKDEYVNVIQLDIEKYSQWTHFRISPFIQHINDPFVYKLSHVRTINRAISPFRTVGYDSGSDFTYAGVSLLGNLTVNRFSRISGHYTWLSGERDRLFAPKHTLTARVNLHNIEDIITSRDLDTEINITGIVHAGGNALNYFPLYQQFAVTSRELPVNALLRMRASAVIRTVTMFYEADLLSRLGHQYVLGYPVRRVMIRAGVEWNFRN